MKSHQGSQHSRPPSSGSSKLFKFAEYTSLAASAVGTIASAASQQVIYAAAPLTVTLALNLLNRQRFEQQTQHRVTTAIAQVDQSLAQLNEQITQIQSRSAIDQNQHIAQLQEQFAAELNRQITQLQEQSTAGLNQRIAELQSQFAAGVNQSIDQSQARSADVLNQRLSQLQDELAAELNQNILELEKTLASIQGDQASLRSVVSGFEARLSRLAPQLALEIQAIQHQLQSQSEPISPTTISSIDRSIQQLTERLFAIEAQTRQLQSDSSRIDPGTFDIIRQSIQQLFDRIAAIESLQFNAPAVPVESSPAVAASVSVKPQPPVILPPPIVEDEGLEELDLNLGIDFGTSFTKVCFRDVARNRSEIVTFTDDPTQVEESLLPTRIGILPDGTLIAGLAASEWQIYEPQVKTIVEFIKMRLASLDLPQQTETWRLEQFPELEQPETVENLCAFYLSRVIRRAQNWIRLNKSELVVNQRIIWSANVGVPVAYCDSPALARFEKVLSLAWLLSNEPQTEQLTLERLTQQMQGLRSRLNSDIPIDCFAVPEIAAEAWSFCNSREADNGFYVFFDIGDGTIDSAAFYYCREAGEPSVDFYTAQVEPLGVTALSQLLAQELNRSVQDVKAILCDRSSQTTQITSSQSRRQVQKLVASTIFKGKEGHGKQFPGFIIPGAVGPDFKHHLNIFVGGGGSKTAFYAETITATHAEFNQQSAGIPPYQLKTLPFPKDLRMHPLSQQEYYRFAVAYGLSLPAYEGAQVRLPSEVADNQPHRMKVRYAARQTSYMDTKDLC